MNGTVPGSKALHDFLAGQSWHTNDATLQLGAGNRHGVFLLERDDRRAVLKVHGPAVSGRRDSFAHEAFMHSFYAAQTGSAVPALLAKDAASRAILFEYVAGSKVDGGGIRDIEAMAQFLVDSNRPEVLERARRSEVPDASESGLSAQDHWRCASSRLDALLGLEATDEETARMHDFLRSEVVPSLSEAKPSGGAGEHQCLSPSDFGFHNIIRREDGSLCFIDFEHAGWDDPAKLIADFIVQPEAPLSESDIDVLFGALGGGLPFGHNIRGRVAEILMIQKCKWTAIILNVFGRPEVHASACAARLAKAVDYWRAPLPNF